MTYVCWNKRNSTAPKIDFQFNSLILFYCESKFNQFRPVEINFLDLENFYFLDTFFLFRSLFAIYSCSVCFDLFLYLLLILPTFIVPTQLLYSLLTYKSCSGTIKVSIDFYSHVNSLQFLYCFLYSLLNSHWFTCFLWCHTVSSVILGSYWSILIFWIPFNLI